MRMSERFEAIHPDAARMAGLAIDAARAGDPAAAIRLNRQLVDWHRARTDCPHVKARAARTMDHLGERLRALRPPDPTSAPIPLRYQSEVKRPSGELKREILETLLADPRPLTVAELLERTELDKSVIRKTLYGLLDAGAVARLPAREHRPDAGFRTHHCWTTVDRAAELARAA